LLLNYENLRIVEVKVRLKKSLTLGELEDLNIDDIGEYYGLDELNGEVYTSGDEAYIRVQPYNSHFEISFDKVDYFDVCFDNDEELNECCELLEIFDINTHFKRFFK
jgi:hypothetical protein